jgi:hypothetical protein
MAWLVLIWPVRGEILPSRDFLGDNFLPPMIALIVGKCNLLAIDDFPATPDNIGDADDVILLLPGISLSAKATLFFDESVVVGEAAFDSRARFLSTFRRVELLPGAAMRLFDEFKASLSSLDEEDSLLDSSRPRFIWMLELRELKWF